MTAASLLPGGASRAQQPGRMARVGFLIAGDAEPSWSLFRKAMTALGYVEGQSVHYEYRVSDANRGRLAQHAEALVSANVNVIVAVRTPAITALKAATSSIPVIFNGLAPEGGIVKNFARPEANLTGFHGATSMLFGKCIQLLREIKPSTRTVGVLLNAPDPFHVVMRQEVEAAAQVEQIDIVPQMVQQPSELNAAFEALAHRGVDGAVVQPSLPLREAADLAVRHGLPAISIRREFAEFGGLVSIGADQSELYRLLAGYADRILKGTPVIELPVQMASRFEVVVNLKTARALGLSMSPMFLIRADEVIE